MSIKDIIFDHLHELVLGYVASLIDVSVVKHLSEQANTCLFCVLVLAVVIDCIFKLVPGDDLIGK